MNSNQNNKVKEIVQKAKSIPAAAYTLLAINLIMLVGFVCQDLTVMYAAGLFVFTVGVITAIGTVTGFWKVPTQLVSQKVQTRIKYLEQKLTKTTKTLDASELQSKSIDTILTILLIIYASSVLNTTLEIFIIVNVLYCMVFLPDESHECKECLKKHAEGIFGKLKYRQ